MPNKFTADIAVVLGIGGYEVILRRDNVATLLACLVGLLEAGAGRLRVLVAVRSDDEPTSSPLPRPPRWLISGRPGASWRLSSPARSCGR